MHPIDGILEVASSTERRLMQEAVAGLVEGLRRELFKQHGKTDEDLLAVTAYKVAASAGQGLLDAIGSRERANALPLQELAQRLNRLIEEVTLLVRTESTEKREPAHRARVAAAGAVEAAGTELRKAFHELDVDFPGLVETLAHRAGRGFLQGLLEPLSGFAKRCRGPLVLWTGVGAALVISGWIGFRSRR
jgi:hypothetical protein